MTARGASAGRSGLGGGAAVLSVGIGVTGLVTYLFFSLASYAVGEEDYGLITLLWSAVFVVVSVLYRPVEQLLSRTIAERDARGQTGAEHLRVAATIQLGLGAAFLVAALAARGPIQDDLFEGSSLLYWIMVVSVLAYAASYFARGFLAGQRRYGLYGGLVLMESTFRVLFAVAAVVGLTSGVGAVALGIAAAPILSLAVVPWALRRRLRPAPAAGTPGATPTDDPAAAADRGTGGETEFTLSRGGGFAGAVLVVMVAEQTFLNAGPLLVKATGGPDSTVLAGLAFNVLLIARAPLQLFQAVQTAILPHLTRLGVGGQRDPFRRSVHVTLVAVAGFAAGVTLVMAAIGPWLMSLVFGGDSTYARGGLVVVAVGMGLYLAAATLNQAALARGQAGRSAGCWAAAALAFVAFLLLPGFDDRVLQVAVGFTSGAGLLCGLLYALYRRS